MGEKVERLYISPPVLATQVARSRRNLGSCGSVSVANSTEEKEGTLQSGLDVCIPFENIASKSTMAGSTEVNLKGMKVNERGRIFN